MVSSFEGDQNNGDKRNSKPQRTDTHWNLKRTHIPWMRYSTSLQEERKARKHINSWFSHLKARVPNRRLFTNS